MIEVISNLGKYEYDIHSLTKAFYPEEEIRISGALRQENEDTCLNFCFDDREGFRGCMPDGERDEVKRALYRLLSEKTGRELPWGALTGIRPVKMAMKRLLEGMSDEETKADMQRKYYVSNKKADLCIDIAHREEDIISGLKKDGYSLYIDIPFCPTTCLYCSFTSNRVGRDRKNVRDYLKALYREMDLVSKVMKDRPLDTVYIGGGTPTTLESEELKDLLDKTGDCFDLCKQREFSLEAGRPDTINREKLRVMKEGGISRISVNPQTMNEETLKLIGRRHTTDDVRRAFKLAREEGFDNINMDIILGLPSEDEKKVEYTMAEIEKLGPDNLTVHSLAIKRASAMGEFIEKNGYKELKDTGKMMDEAQKGAERMGLKPYYLYRQKNMSGNLENTGFAKEGKYGIYNILINEEVQDIVALGAGAISKRVYENGDCRRSANFKMPDQYIANVDEMGLRKEKLFADGSGY